MNHLNKAEATDRANALAKRLGANWSPLVMQNDTWHYGAALKPREGVSVEILPHGAEDVVYTIYLRTAAHEIIIDDRDPTKLLPAATKKLLAQLDILAGICADLKTVLHT